MDKESVILIVDDEKEIVRDLTGLFSGMGHDVLTASDNAEAIRTINAVSLDLIIIEVNILYGIEILKHIKAKKPKMKVVVYSRCDYETKKKAEEAGIDEFLPKSAEISMLVDVVQDVLK